MREDERQQMTSTDILIYGKMLTDANSALLFVLTLVWTLNVFIALLTAVTLCLRCIRKRVIGTPQYKTYTVVQIEEGCQHSTTETINLETSEAEMGDHKEGDSVSLLHEEEKGERYEKKDRVSNEEVIHTSSGNETERTEELADDMGEPKKRPSSTDNDISLLESVLIHSERSKIDTETSQGDTTESLSDVNTPDNVLKWNESIRLQNLPDQHCNIRAMKDGELSKSTEEMLSRPIPTPRKTVTPGVSKSQLSTSKASLLDDSEDTHTTSKASLLDDSEDTHTNNEEGPQETRKSQSSEKLETESASPDSNSTLLNEIATVSNNTEIIPLKKVSEASKSTEVRDSNEQLKVNPTDDKSLHAVTTAYEVLPVSGSKKLEKGIKEDGEDTADKTTDILSPDVKKEENAGADYEENQLLERDKSDICASNLPPLPASLPRGRQSKKSKRQLIQSKVNEHQADKEEIRDGRQAPVELVKHQNGKPFDAVSLTVEETHQQVKTLNTTFPSSKTRKGSKKPTGPPPVPPSQTQDTSLSTTDQKSFETIQLPEKHSPPLTKHEEQPSKEGIHDTVNTALVQNVPSAARKVIKPSHPPPSPPPVIRQKEMCVVSLLHSASAGSPLSAETVEQPLFPIKHKLTNHTESLSLHDETAESDQHLRTDSRSCDEVSDLQSAKTTLPHKYGRLTAAVTNAGVLNLQRQALRRVNHGTQDIVLPSALTVHQGGLQEDHTHERNRSPNTNRNVKSKDKACVKALVPTSDKNPSTRDTTLKKTDPDERLGGGMCISVKRKTRNTPVTSTVDTLNCNNVPVKEEHTASDSYELDNQTMKPPLASKPKLLTGGAHKEGSGVGEMKEMKPVVPKKPPRKT